MISSIEKVNPFSTEKINLIQYLPGRVVKTIWLNENGMNEWIPQPSCMAEPVEGKTQSCNISIRLYQKIWRNNKGSVRIKQTARPKWPGFVFYRRASCYFTDAMQMSRCPAKACYSTSVTYCPWTSKFRNSASIRLLPLST